MDLLNILLLFFSIFLFFASFNSKSFRAFSLQFLLASLLVYLAMVGI